jgi:hypothetical protein
VSELTYLKTAVMRKLLLVAFVSVLASFGAQAQVGQGGIKATITDDSGEPLPFANIIVKQNGSQVTGGQSDFDGKVSIKPITPGTYDVEISSLGFGTKQISGVRVTTGVTTQLPKNQTQMSTAVEMLGMVEVVDYKVPLFEKGSSKQETITADDIKKMTARSPSELAATAGGTYSSDNGSSALNIRGSRSDANYYFIDGVKVRGSSAIPRASISQITVITGGLPARYGDVTGGVVSITTRGVSSEYHGGIEYLTSGVKLGENTYIGTDPYGYNLLEMSISGPFLSKTDSNNIKKPLLGFFLSGNVTSNLDPRPSAVGSWKIKDDQLDILKSDPLRQGFTDNSVIPNTDYYRLDNFERVNVRPNTNNRGGNIAGKVTVATTDNTDLTFGGSLNYSQGKTYDYDHSLFDYESYPEVTNLDWRVYGRFTQRFDNGQVEDGSSSSLIKNAFYSIQVDYSQEYFKRQNPILKDDLFKYGHIGKFETFQTKDYAIGQDSTTGLFGQIQQTNRDTLITFVPGTSNPELATFTQRYYELNGWEGFDAEGNPIFDPARVAALSNTNNIQSGGGLINGDNLDGRSRSVYGMWVYNSDVTNARGGNTDRFQENITNQVRVTAQGSADIKNHAFMLGFEYEQRVDRAYAVSPRGLWQVARLRANTHVSELDFENPQIEYPGPYISYPRLNASPGEYDGSNPNEAQGFIDYNLRKAIGLDPDGVDFLDVNAIDPDLYKIEYFSADELYNGGSSYVSYYGYDPYGNRITDNPTFDDFFTARDDFGNYTRPIAAFQPIYVAGYIEDKFEFEDLIFNIGLRVDRYDANQQVLKDPFVLFPTVKAGEQEAMELLEEGTERPSTIGDDYVVYVDNVQSPTDILGYRNGNVWYNAQGTELSDASALRVSNGLPAPLLVDKDNTNSVDITSESFEDYSPKTNFMPRIAFNFPISDVAKFFAHYDILTKRPTTGSRLDPSDYYFLESRASSATLNNPSLQPEKTIDYEIGFQQALTTSMALTISAFYRESRDLVSATRVFDAYPIEYVSYDNLDFATVKGMTVSYDLRQTKNLTVRASYTLQFAEGTGSNATTGLNLARSGQPNLRAPIRLSYDQRHQIVGNVDYRYGSGKDYDGPVLGDRQIFKNTGANLQIRGGSGIPYNPQSNFTSTRLFSNSPSPLQKGAINSASLPWSFRFDLNLDRDFTYAKEGGKHEYYFNVFLQVRNLLNTRNVNGVYRATGNPDDDGYLNSAFGLQFAGEQNSTAAFQEYYTMKLWNPTNWQLPRRFRIGVRMSF